ncbi:MAG: bifunctional demethylmenaquinone methyltransferase/2-methoxy-6-polyprenyl-1,4-benzoquinol methylase UbiE [Pirellulales bacterium]
MSVDKSGTRVRSMFGEIAGRYDFLNHFLSGGVDYYWRWRTVRNVPARDDAPVLDVCTGTGDLALAYAKRTKADVVGADFCHEMLDLGRQKAAKIGRDGQVAFVEADAQHLPFPDDMFQIVTVAFGLRNVSDTDRGLREMTRVCKPGGKVAVLEFTTPRSQPFKAVYQWYFKNILPRIGQALARNSKAAYEYLPESVGEFPAYQALADRMTAAGLTDVTFRPMTFGIATLYVGEKA